MLRHLAPRPGYQELTQPAAPESAQAQTSQFGNRFMGQPQPQQQPQQQLSQAQMQQQQQGSSIVGVTDTQSQSNGGPEKEMNLAAVLHYLQSEWRRWERDRNEWEIERAEMRARIALLEGQRKSAENLKVDLLKRVKLLEYALRTERSSARASSSTLGRSSTLPPSRLVALQDEDARSSSEREGSGSEASDEGDKAKASNTNGVHATAMNRGATLAARATPESTGAWKVIGAAPRDPKSRERSREYLKQCLQEVSYLTSPGALNPLSPRPPVELDPVDETGEAPDQSSNPALPDRPQKVMPENPIASTFTNPDLAVNGFKPIPPLNGLPNGDHAHATSSETPSGSLAVPKSDGLHSVTIVDSKPPSSPLVKTSRLPDPSSQEVQGEPQLLTAIYRPDSKAAWREELRAANEQAEKARSSRGSVKSEHMDDDQLSQLSSNSAEDEMKPEEPVERSWTSRRTLKSHLDVARTVAFAHGPTLLLASGSDDCTVKVWSADTHSVLTSPRSTTEIEPIMTYRGHTAPVTSVQISTAAGLIFSASMDATVRIWRLPPNDHDPYAPYDPSMAIQTLESHSEAVWDLLLLPAREPKRSGKHGAVRLASASADGTVKLWEENESGVWEPQDSLFIGTGVIPTALAHNLALDRLLVGMSNGQFGVWDANETPARLRKTLGTVSDAAQINGIMCHPTMPILVTAAEDGNLRFFDIRTGNLTHTILAHPSPCTSIILSPYSPTTLLTSSTDCSIRSWDISKKMSLQDLSGHRQKSDEGVCGLGGHPELPIVASAGGDGVIRLWVAV